MSYQDNFGSRHTHDGRGGFFGFLGFFAWLGIDKHNKMFCKFYIGQTTIPNYNKNISAHTLGF